MMMTNNSHLALLLASIRNRLAAALPAAAVAGLVAASGGWMPTASFADDVIVRTYQEPAGDQVGSLSVRLDQPLAQRDAVSHVILLDTSASQIGEHRQMALDVLAAFLKSLPENDQVEVFAYDVKVAPLTSGWTTPESAAAEVAEKIQSRFPAGSSNLSAALQAAQKELSSVKTGSVLIIGDGMSTAHLFQPQELQELTAQYRDQQIPVHSFAVGSKTDLRLLGILGEETGGFVVRDEWSKSSLTAEQVAKLLNDAVHLQVFYPDQISISEADVSLLPQRALPMRTDRETVYLFKGPVQAGTTLSVTGTWNDQPVQLEYNIPEIARRSGNTFLGAYWNEAQMTQGLNIGLAGEWMVNYAQQDFEDQISLLSAEGEQALGAGDLKKAEQIGSLLQRIDPQNPEGALLIHQARQKGMLVAQLPDAPGPAGSNPDDQDPSIPAPGTAIPPNLVPREAPVPSDNISNYEALVQAKGQKLQAEVEVQIDRAYDLVENSLGAQAEEVLERTRSTIKSATDVPPELVNRLLRKVNGVLESVRNRRAQFDAQQQERQRRMAELEVTTRLIDYANERDLQLQQLVDRVRALMVEAYHGNPDAFERAESVAREILSNYPGSAIGNAEVMVTEAAGQIDKVARLRALRADKFLETMYLVELAHVPFPDEPPIVYPPAEVWWALTKMREKWKSVDLKSTSKNEEKIYKALDSITSVEFPATGLYNALDYISELHDIPIIPKRSVLEDIEGMTGEEEVNLVISGIKLKSALKLMFSEIEPPLTYVIEDEVMKITTVDDANDPTNLQLRVYPVADLVIPVQPLGGGMGMMGMGMGGMGMGGMGMGGMGMMGGMGGMGGMGMMGGFGGGMGFNSIPATPVLERPADLPNEPVQLDMGKKKPAN